MSYSNSPPATLCGGPRLIAGSQDFVVRLAVELHGSVAELAAELQSSVANASPALAAKTLYAEKLVAIIHLTNSAMLVLSKPAYTAARILHQLWEISSAVECTWLPGGVHNILNRKYKQPFPMKHIFNLFTKTIHIGADLLKLLTQLPAFSTSCERLAQQWKVLDSREEYTAFKTGRTNNRFP